MPPNVSAPLDSTSRSTFGLNSGSKKPTVPAMMSIKLSVGLFLIEDRLTGAPSFGGSVKRWAISCQRV